VKETRLSYLANIFLSIIFLVAVIYSQPPISAPANLPALSQNTAELVHFGDLIDVDVVGSFEYDWRGSLNPEGFLDGLDRIEEQIYGLCKSEDELAAVISKQYSVALRDPKVIVKIVDRSNRAVVFLDGAVKFPQRFQIKRPVLLNELLVISGGITDKTSGEIKIFRPRNLNCESQQGESIGDASQAGQSNGSNVTLIKITDLLSGMQEANPRILSGDIITVVEALPIYLIGGVAVPKQISSRSELTLSRAIASAGGVSKNGLEDKITIFRRDGKERLVIETSLKKIKANQAEDPVLRAQDIIEVGEKGRERRKFPPSVEAPAAGDNFTKLPLRIID